MKRNNKKLNILVCTSLILGLGSQMGLVASANYSNLEQRQNQLKQESNNVSGKISETDATMANLEEQKAVLEEEAAKLQENIDEIVQKIVAHEQKITELDEESETLEKKVDVLKERIKKRDSVIKTQARSVQIKGSPENVLDILLEAENVTDLLGRMELVSTLIGTNYDILEDQKRDQETVEKSLAKIKKNRTKQEELKEQLNVEKNNILAQQVEFDYKIEQVADELNLSAEKRAKFVEQSAALAAESSSLNGEMQRVRKQIVASQEAARREQLSAAKDHQLNQKQQASTSTSQGNKPAANTGGWIRPASGYVSNPFGPNSFYDSGFHYGIDIAGSGPILAAKSGVVTSAGWLGIGGYTVIIDHGGGVTTLYAHMQPGLSVYPGQTVSQGQQLGIMGTTGFSTGVHLHFEIRINGQHVNPAHYVAF